VVAEQDLAVGPVVRVAKRSDAERTTVHQVAQEDGSPAVGRVGPDRGEEALEVAMDVADDQDGQRDRSNSSAGPSRRRTARV
jgi:hypothetical protein